MSNPRKLKNTTASAAIERRSCLEGHLEQNAMHVLGQKRATSKYNATVKALEFDRTPAFYFGGYGKYLFSIPKWKLYVIVLGFSYFL